MGKNDNDKTPKKHNLRKRRGKKNYKISESSDDSDDSSDWVPGMEEEDENDVERALEFQKFIQKMFPSKHQSEKVKQLTNIKKMLKDENDESSKETKKKKKKIKKVKKKNNKDYIEECEDEEDEEDDEDEEDEVEEDEEEEVDEEDEEDWMKYMEGEDIDPQNMKFNIVFKIADKNMFDFADEEENYEEDEWNKEFEKAMLKEDKKMQKLEKLKKGDKVKVKLDGWKNEHIGKITRKYKKSQAFDVLLNDKNLDKRKWKKVLFTDLTPINEDEELKNTLDELKELIDTKKGKGKKAMMKKFEAMSEKYEQKMEKKKKKETEKQKAKNSVEFRKLLREKSATNDFTHFKKLTLDNQKNILKRLEEVQKYTKIEKPYRLQLIESDIPVEFKANALKKINILNYMDPSSGEYYKIKQWVDTFMNIPFNKYNNLSLTLEDGVEKCNSFMEDAKKTLDDAVYGLEDAKMQIMQMIGQWIANPNSVGSAIAIKGPPGTGKTTLVKQGISKILQRPFAFLALGGATDSSFLEGHSYTYEGSNWGKIVDILIHSKCMNPVIYFDELDKISSTPKGEEITGILTHLTDTSQNDKFHDKYFSSIDFDLSKCLFIFSYNDESKINPILKDRMYRITTEGYDKKEKTKIATDYLIPTIIKNVKFKKEDIVIPEETLHHIVDNLTDGEKGVRNLKRCLEIIYTKLNLYRLMKPDSELFEKEKALKVEFPFTVDVEIVKKLIKKVGSNKPPFGMYI